MKCGSRAPAHNASLKGVLRTIIVQDLTLTAVLSVDFNARVYVKLQQNHWNMKYGSRVPAHCACLKGVLRTIIMQGLTLTAVTAADFNDRVYAKL